MKRKRTKWNQVPWTEFHEGTMDGLPEAARPERIWVNSRYQVSVWTFQAPAPFGVMMHLSIKTHDKQAHHDWRDMQRIKNELCGPECEAVELFPAESRLVDTANQYHLFVCRDFRFPFGFQDRLVAEGDGFGSAWGSGARQRPFEDRPADCRSARELDRRMGQLLEGGMDD